MGVFDGPRVCGGDDRRRAEVRASGHPGFIKHLDGHLRLYGVLELREQMGRNTSKWTANPLPLPNATRQQIKRLEKADRAVAHLRKTVDRRPPVDVGIFNQELPGETPPASDD